jgi:ATP-dependent Clp protease ATP-binding subunit ClpC
MVEAAIQQAEQQSVEVEAPESEQTAPDTAVPSTAEAESSTPSVLVSAPQHFERYTESAKQVVNLAKEEARTLELDSIGAEHLLLGLVAEGSGIAAQVLKSEGIKIDDARSEVAKLVEQGSSPRPEDIPLAKNARLILDRATDAARNRNQKQVSTAHLLQSVLEVKDDRVLNILKSFEVSPAAIEERLTQMLSDSPDAEES